MAAARSGAPHGSVYFADEQTAGRGRGDHAWHSAAGEGLYVSVLLRPQPGAVVSAAACRWRQDWLLPMRFAPSPGSLSICAGPTTFCLARARRAGSWWKRKVEAQPEAASAFAVVGIGINVHQRSFDPGLATPGNVARSRSRLRVWTTDQPSGAARRPAKIAGARNARAARSGGARDDSGTCGESLDLGAGPARRSARAAGLHGHNRRFGRARISCSCARSRVWCRCRPGESGKQRLSLSY